MKKKYIRTVFFDHIKKVWQSFFVNKTGKIIFDKPYKYLNDFKKKFIKNNRYKKIDKSESRGYITVKNEKKIQDKIDRLLRKKKLNDIQKEILKNYEFSYNYKNQKIRDKLKIKEVYDKDNTLIYFFDAIICKITTSYFQTFLQQFKLFKELFLRRKMDRFKRFIITIDFMGLSIEGVIHRKFWSGLKNFSTVISNIIDDNFYFEQIDWLRERIKITFKGIR